MQFQQLLLSHKFEISTVSNIEVDSLFCIIEFLQYILLHLSFILAYPCFISRMKVSIEYEI